MKFRSMILVLTIAFSAIFVTMIGSSYAYYVATDGTNISIQTSDMDPNLSVVFEETQYINIKNAIPVSSKLYAENYKFTISPNNEIISDPNNFNIQIGIDDLYIDDTLKVEDFNYSLYCVGKESGFDVASFAVSGTGEDFIDEAIENDYFLLGRSPTMAGEAIDCDLYIWLQDNGEDQNHLMNKKFSGIIKVNMIFKN